MDTELVLRAQKGDEQAFASLAVALGNRLYAVAHGVALVIDVFSFQETTADMLANVRQMVEGVDIEPLPAATPTP